MTKNLNQRPACGNQFCDILIKTNRHRFTDWEFESVNLWHK